MRIQTLFHPLPSNYCIIREQCSDFITESEGLPLLKNLPSQYGDFHKVKVRHKKGTNQTPVDSLFDETFDVFYRQAIFAYGEKSFEAEELSETLCPYYIFPTDGYKYLYSKEVENSSNTYKQMFDILVETFDHSQSKEVLTDILKFTYRHTNLVEGIVSGSEIIIYGIPYYYAIKRDTIENYSDFITQLSENL